VCHLRNVINFLIDSIPSLHSDGIPRQRAIAPGGGETTYRKTALAHRVPVPSLRGMRSTRFSTNIQKTPAAHDPTGFKSTWSSRREGGGYMCGSNMISGNCGNRAGSFDSPPCKVFAESFPEQPCEAKTNNLVLGDLAASAARLIASNRPPSIQKRFAGQQRTCANRRKPGANLPNGRGRGNCALRAGKRTFPNSGIRIPLPRGKIAAVINSQPHLRHWTLLAQKRPGGRQGHGSQPQLGRPEQRTRNAPLGRGLILEGWQGQGFCAPPPDSQGSGKP
jgi:hypothetical protein